MILPPPELPAVCNACGHRVPFERITERCYCVLLTARSHQTFTQELQMLKKVADFYRRNPAAEGQVQPHVMRVIRSQDPAVRKKLFENIPLAQIEMPPAQEPRVSDPHPEDEEVVEYLRHHSFRLEGRMRAVAEQAERTKRALGQVKCPRCEVGHMELVDEREGGRHLA